MGSGDEVLTPGQRLVLQAICDHFREHGMWPTFISIDRQLRRAHGTDTRAIFMTLPDSLVVKPRPGMGPTDTDELRLRLPGIHACHGGAEDTERFVRLLRWLAQKEVEFEPEADSEETMPRVASHDVAEHLKLDETNHAAIQRLYAMLQLDRWGLGGSSRGPDGWYVSLAPDIWRFRDVQTVEDCVRARKQWIAEAHAASPHLRTPASSVYYHVRVSTKSRPNWDEVRLDLSGEELESRFLSPRREGRPIVINGVAIPIDDLAQLRINRTEQPSAQLRPIVQTELRAHTVAAPMIPEDWQVADKGDDVTDRFITEPPGSTTTPSAVPLSQPAVPPRRATAYVDRQIVAAIKAKVGTTKFDATKLLN